MSEKTAALPRPTSSVWGYISSPMSFVRQRFELGTRFVGLAKELRSDYDLFVQKNFWDMVCSVADTGFRHLDSVAAFGLAYALRKTAWGYFLAVGWVVNKVFFCQEAERSLSDRKFTVGDALRENASVAKKSVEVAAEGMAKTELLDRQTSKLIDGSRKLVDRLASDLEDAIRAIQASDTKEAKKVEVPVKGNMISVDLNKTKLAKQQELVVRHAQVVKDAAQSKLNEMEKAPLAKIVKEHRALEASAGNYDECQEELNRIEKTGDKEKLEKCRDKIELLKSNLGELAELQKKRETQFTKQKEAFIQLYSSLLVEQDCSEMIIQAVKPAATLSSMLTLVVADTAEIVVTLIIPGSALVVRLIKWVAGAYAAGTLTEMLVESKAITCEAHEVLKKSARAKAEKVMNAKLKASGS